MPLRIAGNVWPGYEPFYLARDLGFFHSPVQLLQMPSATTVLTVFRGGNADAIEVTLDEALLLLEDGMDVRAVLLLDISNGGDVLMARPDIKSLAALRDKRIGAENTALGAYMLSRALDHAGLTPAEIKLVPLSPDQQEAAYDSGQVDAVVCFEPLRTKILKKGARILFDSTQIPNEIVDVLIVRADVLEKRPDVVKDIQAAWFRALEYLKANPADACERMAKREQLSRTEFQATLNLLKFGEYAENERFLTGSEPALIPTANRLIETMLKQKLLTRQLDPQILLQRVTLPARDAP